MADAGGDLEQDAEACWDLGSGATMKDWELALGDALFIGPGEHPPNASDVESSHYEDYTELRANVHARGVMAHNITFRRWSDLEVARKVHSVAFQFRLPYTPSASTAAEENGQTLEGGFFVYDGAGVDHGVAFQWTINPWDRVKYQRLWTWTGSEWAPTDKSLGAADAGWHDFAATVDLCTQSAAMTIDGASMARELTETRKPEFGLDKAARLQIEAVSVDPGAAGTYRVPHRVEFRNWSWSACECEVH